MAKRSAISRVIAVLDAIAVRGGTIRYAELQKILAPVGPNTVIRFLRELCQCGVLTHRSDGTYGLGDAPMYWAISVPRERDLRWLARPLLVKLHRQLEATVCLSVTYDQKITLLDRIVHPSCPPLLARGYFAPMNPIHMGGVFFVDDLRCRDLLAIKSDLAELRDCTLSAKEASELFVQSRLLGYFEDPSLFYRNFRICAPVRDLHEVRACIGIATFPEQMNDAFRIRCRESIQSAARELSAILIHAEEMRDPRS